MSGINCSVNFLTLKQIGYEESNVAVSFYHDRTHFEQNSKNLYATYAEEFNLQQGRRFVIHNRLATTPAKMSKLKDQVRELDDLLTNSSQNDQASSIKPTQLSNHFLSYLNSGLSKMIWLSSSRLLLIMQDSTLVWIIIDTISGDLIRILTDKTLTTGFGVSNSSHLSGKFICDAALFIKESNTTSPILILTYSDKSKVDLITFNKAGQVNDYLKNSKDLVKLEKINTFEPFLTSYEFACPSIYRIEKRISILSSENGNSKTFSVWWPNDGQIVWKPITNESSTANKQTISLLERDDLRNNILILSTNLADSNLMEHLFKSDGLLLGLNYMNENNLIAIEQTETTTHNYMISIYRYELPNEIDVNGVKNLIGSSLNTTGFKAKNSLKIRLGSFALNSKIASVEQIKFGKKYVLMLATDQTLILYDKNRNLTRKFKLSWKDSTKQDDIEFFNGIEWLLEDLLFAAYNINGQLKIFDVGFSEINLFYMTRYQIEFKSISEYLNSNIFMPMQLSNNSNNKNNNNNSKKLSSAILPSSVTSNNLNNFVRLVSSRNIFTDSLISCFCYSRGPFGLFRLSLPDNFNHICLVNHYLKNSQEININKDHQDGSFTVSNILQTNNPFVSKHLTSAVNLLNTLNWDEESHLCLSILNRVLNFILSERVSFNFKIEMLVEEAFGSFYKPKRALLEKTIYENKHQVSRYARRFFYQLLKHDSLNKAFLLAVDIGAKDLFNDLYFCSLDKRERQIAEICRKKYQEILLEEKQSKIRNELNKSITTIDDNIKGNETEFDRYSVSSSENSSLDSDAGDSVDSEFENILSDAQKQQMEKNARFKLSKKNLKFLLQDDLASNRQISQPQTPNVYSEAEIENFATNILNENMFIYQNL